MTAPTLTVTAAPTVHKSQSFSCQPKSQANPGHAQPQPTDSSASSSSLFLNDQQQQQQNRLTSKSLSNLPAATAAAFDFDLPSLDFDTGIDFDPTLPVSRKLQLSPNEKTTLAPNAANLEGPRPRTDKMGRRKSILGRPHSWVPTSKATADTRPASEKSTEPNGGHVKTTETQDQNNNKKEAPGSGLLQLPPERTGGALSSLARRSWISSSKTPSPSANATESSDYVSHASRERSLSTSSNKLKKLTRKRQGSTNDNEGSKSSDSLGKLGSYLGKMKQRPQNGLSKGAAQHDTDSAASSITSSAPASTATRPSNAASDNTFPSVVVEEVARPPTAQARDPLWSVFKNLESEYAKFQAKKPAEKMRHVRTVLIPFLRGHASHPSTKKLTLEHVEQRANILHKWWNGLLELLDGPSQGAVPGTDRPTLHEVTTLVMMRPEWRLNTPYFRPLSERNLGEASKRRGQPQSANAANDSEGSVDSDFIAESAEHNVRTMFTSNLMRQMAIVVDKMSQRHMPWSMINFAGKACAYAFFFVPGVADVLVSLWSLTADLMRRVADEFHVQRRGKGESDDIVALFPPNLNRLSWTSVKGMARILREPTKLPHAAAKINWNGPWMARWRGRDTDLFFIFCKYYFILAEEFIPSELALVEKSRIPAFVLVNAQILSALDSTVHRQAAFNNAMAFPSADGIDATATALPIAPNNNVMKGMTENRLIVLLKDFLSASSVAFMAARHTFAEAFMALMKASAKRTSLFDHNACFTLCDFLEESLVAYDGYVDVHRPTLEYIDWPFWIDVCRKMMASSNAGSEVRVLSLVFSIWDAIVSNPSRKELVCLDWLLQEDIFYKWFNNWCPMVRAYYMRLVCWRMCRNTGSPSELDTKIFAVVNSRLKTVWSHYIWLKQEADSKGKVPPSTAPCWPTPGKRFVIIRTEVPAAQSGLMLGFDSFSTPMGPLETAVSPPSPRGSAEMSAVEPAAYKKKWNLFGKVLSFGSTSGPNDLETIRRETAAARKHSAPPKSSETPTPPASDTDSLGSSPTYEALQYVFRFTLQWHSQGATAPLGRILTRPRLPAPAQSCINAQANQGDGSPPPLPASRPAPTRAFSGSANSGLIDAAKNANPGDVSPTTVRTMMQYADDDISVSLSPIEQRSSNGQSPWSAPQIATSETLVGPVKPMGIYMQSSTYAGRALAEWSTVVAECNSFVDRRREEGVLSLEDVEVPALGVEGFRKIG
ncbi:hypothetical protein PFICI_00822 [Pestalotiopsis fici W106-1]|uniref:DUF1765-domain-containing protein n=1 Tax=Pestalotiopsis fici (strain W106-1 / CGMCC3.15140) TaxID=1229662 RepID=W3XLW9_PESFW|nr:uncharacterized protein PFICI_00822 [Pestalotiopsis fici W106-1]ETS86994.1 hypothetical protein PFICI_00822 [Pestalotiopsis fici W106-1]